MNKKLKLYEFQESLNTLLEVAEKIGPSSSSLGKVDDQKSKAKQL